MDAENGFMFDDDLFEEERTESIVEESFQARYEDPAWFTDQSTIDSSSDSKDEVTLVKYNADYCYLQGNYCAAVDNYEKMLQLLPANNIVTRRECYDNLARCCMKEERLCEGLRYANLLQDSSATVEQLTVSLSCLVDVCLHCGLYKFAILHCTRLIKIHKLNSRVWMRLAYSLACETGIFLPNSEKLQKITSKPGGKFSCQCNKDTCEFRCTSKNEIGAMNSIVDEKLTLPNCSKNEGQTITLWDPKCNSIMVLFCVIMSKYILTGIQGTAFGFSAETIAAQISTLDKDIDLLTYETDCSVILAPLDILVTKNVFGYDKEFGRIKNPSDAAEEFVDRGSSQFASGTSGISYSSVLSETWGNFVDTWLQPVIDIAGQ